MPSILVATGFVRIDADARPAVKAITALGQTAGLALTTTLAPALATVSTGLLAVASSAAVAGGAASAFGAAVIPQFKAIGEASQKQATAEEAKTKATLASSEAQKLAKKYGFEYGTQVKITSKMTAEAREHAKQYNSALSSSQSASKSATMAQAIYNEKLAAMTPATRGTAVAFQKLKDDFKTWSDSLSGSTMPMFTRGIEWLRGLLPRLSPVVKDVAQELDRFTNSLRMGVAGQVFQQFGQNIKTNGSGALGGFLDVVRNITVGFVGLLNTFLPMSSKVNGGLVELTQRFAEWGATSQNSTGVQAMIKMAQDSVPAFVQLGKALGDVISAAGPLSGVGLKVLTVFAQIVDAIPTPVLRLLVPAIIAVNLALKAYAVYQAAATAATWLFGTSVTASTGIVYTSRAALIAHRIILLATAVATAATTAATWLWTAATTAAGVALTVLRGIMLAFRYALVLVRVAVAATTLGLRLMAIALISSPIGLVIAALALLGIAFVVLWKKSETFRNIVKGAWEGIKVAAEAVGKWFAGPFTDFFKRVWDLIYSYYLKPIIWWWTVAVPAAAKFLWNAVVGFFNLLVDGVKFAWGLYKKLIIDPFLWFYTKALPAAAKFLWNTIVGAFNLLVSGVMFHYNLFKSRILNPLIGFFTVTVPNAGRTMRNKVVQWWNDLVVGLTGVYNLLKLKIFNPIGDFFTKTIPGWARTMRDKVKGFFTDMRDGIGTIWSGIQSKTKAPVNWVISHVWNDGILNVWKTITGWIGISNKLGKIKLLAAGGTVGREPFGMFNRPTAIVGEGNSAYPEYVIPTDPKYATRAKGLWQAAGVHFMEDGGILGSIGSAISKAAGTATSLAKGAVDFFTDPTAKAKKLFQGPLGRLGSLGKSPWATMVARLPHMAVDGLMKAVKSIGSDLGSSVLGAVGLGSGSGGSGVARYRNIVQILLRMVGQPLAYTDLTLRRMNQESGGNPRAVNLWDSNAKAGYPSVGLMQVIRGTFQAYAGKYRNTGPFMYGVSVDPAANIYASMKYALSRYGSLQSAYGRPGGYANGTSGTAGGMHLFGERGPEVGFSPSGWRILNARRTAGLAGGTNIIIERLVLENHGVLGSQHEVENWLVTSLTELKRKGRTP